MCDDQRRFDSGDRSTISDGELLELFERRRPSAAGFRAGVDERIREREEAPSGSNPGGGSFRARAAGLAPGVLGGGSLALKGVTAAKGAQGVLLFPIAAIAGAVGVFTLSARSLRGEAAPGEIPTDGTAGTEETFLDRSERGASGLWLGLLVLVMLAPPALAADLVVLWLCITMISLVYGVRRLRSLGRLDRDVTARLVCGVVAVPALHIVILGPLFGAPLPTSDLGPGASFWLLVVGAVLLDRLAPSPERRRGLLVCAALAVLWNGPSLTYSDAPAVRHAAERVELDPHDEANWRAVAAAHRVLMSIGEEPFVTEGIRAAVLEALDPSDTDVPAEVWSAASDMGLLDDKALARLAERAELERPTAVPYDGPLGPKRLFHDRYELPALVAAFDPGDAQRSAQAIELRREWPSASSHMTMGEAMFVIRGLEALGRTAELEEMREQVFALLEAHWVRPQLLSLFDQPGGFTPNPRKEHSSSPEATALALELMVRYGVPDAIDVRWLRSYLRRASVANTIFEQHPAIRLEARAGLLRLHRQIGLPPRGFVASLLGERYHLALALCLALAALALRMAPKEAVGSGVGAQP